MNTKWSGVFTLGIFFVITIVGFILWVGGLLFIWSILKILGFSTDPWAMISAFSTAIAATAVFSAGFIAYRELSEVASSRHLDVADRLFEELNSPKNIEARRWIFVNLPDNPEDGIRTLTTEGHAAVKQVLNSLDRVAFMTQAGWIPDDIIMPWMHPMVAKAWVKLEPYVIYERKRRNEPYYYQKVSELAERINLWRQKNLVDATIKWVEDAL
jgi:hypothetical protein